MGTSLPYGAAKEDDIEVWLMCHGILQNGQIERRIIDLSKPKFDLFWASLAQSSLLLLITNS